MIAPVSYRFSTYPGVECYNLDPGLILALKLINPVLQSTVYTTWALQHTNFIVTVAAPHARAPPCEALHAKVKAPCSSIITRTL